MAYSAAVNIERLPGSSQIVIEVLETDAENTSQWSTVASATNTVRVNGTALATGDAFTLGPNGFVEELVCELVSAGSGTATTVQPRAGKASGWSDGTIEELYTTGPATAFERAPGPVPFSAREPFAIYGNSQADSGSDGVIRTLLRIKVER